MIRQDRTQEMTVVVLETRLHGHEAECARRYGETTAAITRLHERLDAWNKTAIGLLISVLLLLCAQLVMTGLKGK